jgi:VIT1/CCC1 family predicted Fe2+/Mn2+ transporter
LGFKLKLSKVLVHPSGVSILLTKHETDKLQDGNYHNITISSSRVQKMGGFLPILPILGGIGAITGIVTSIVNAVKSSRK